MVAMVRALPAIAAAEYVRKNELRYGRDGPQASQAVQPVVRRTATRSGDVVTVHTGTGMRPFVMRWKNAPHASARLKCKIAMLEGKIDRAQIEEITQGERERKVGAYRAEMVRAKVELCRAYAQQPTYSVVVES